MENMKEIMMKLEEAAKEYDDLELFIAETGWLDFMNQFTTAEEGEPITDEEAKEIDEILIRAYNNVHSVHSTI